MKPERTTCALALLAIVLIAACISLSPALGAEPSMSEYTCYPIFLTSTVTPNVMIMLDNSGSMNYRAYANQRYDHTKSYYGYFEPHKHYYYSQQKIPQVSAGFGRQRNTAVVPQSAGRTMGR